MGCVESSIGEGSENGDAFSSNLGAGKEHYQLCCYNKKTCDSTDESYNNFGAISGLKFFAAIFVVMGLCGCVSGVLGMKLANDPYFASQPVISNGYMAAAGPGGMMGVPTQPAYTTAQATG